MVFGPFLGVFGGFYWGGVKFWGFLGFWGFWGVLGGPVFGFLGGPIFIGSGVSVIFT